MPKESSKPESKMDTSMMHPSSPIYLPSTVNSIADWLTLLREDSLAKTSAPQEDEPDLMALAAASGGKCLDAFGKWDPSTSSLRTLQESLLEERPEPWSESWPVSGTMRSGTCYRLPPLVPRTSVGGGGVLPTPNQGAGNQASANTKRWNGFNTLEAMAKNDAWPGHIPSPTVSDLFTGNLGSTQPQWAARFPTPIGSQARSEGMINQMRGLVDAGEMTVEEAEQMIGGSLTPDRMATWYPTPQTTDAPDGGGPPNKNANTTQWNGVNSLGQMAKQGLWPTPRAQIKRTINQREGGHRSDLEEVMGEVAPETVGGQLNPNFVEWLMGVPQGWVSLEPLPPEHWERWLTEPHWANGEWPGVPRVATGVKDRVNQLKMMGNGIVPDCPAAFLQGVAWSK